jgi:hypothetical protein
LNDAVEAYGEPECILYDDINIAIKTAICFAVSAFRSDLHSLQRSQSKNLEGLNFRPAMFKYTDPLNTN